MIPGGESSIKEELKTTDNDTRVRKLNTGGTIT